VERINVVIVYPQQQWTEFIPRCDSYVMEIDQSRNYYSCEAFGYLARNCRNWGNVGQERRLEYGDNSNNT